MSAVTLPHIFHEGDDNHAEAVARLKHYYFARAPRKSKGDSSRRNEIDLPRFSGSQFDSYGRLEGDHYEFTDADLIAPSLLDAPWNGDAVLAVTTDLQADLHNLLKKFAPTLQLHELTNEHFEKLMGPVSPGQDIWDLLRGRPFLKGWKAGPTRVSKLLARKRPHLFPIFDSHIRNALGLLDSLGHWKAMHTLLRPENDLVQRLEKMRDDAGLDADTCSILRVFDVVVWHQQSQKNWKMPAQ